MNEKATSVDVLSSTYASGGTLVTEVDPRILKPHPLNPEIYGEDEDIEDLTGAIARSLWVKRVVITPEYKIISGHRRVRATIILGWQKIPVEIRSFESELEELEALLLENQYREKNNEQKVREGMLWERVEDEVRPAPKNIPLEGISMTSEQILALMHRGYESPALALKHLVDVHLAQNSIKDEQIPSSPTVSSLIDNLEYLQSQQIRALGKAIAIRKPELIDAMVTGLMHERDLAKKMVKVIAQVYPEVIFNFVQEDGGKKS